MEHAEKEFWKRQKLLVIAPHADDETISCGGLLAKAKEAGGETFVIVLSIGDLAHYKEGTKRVSTATRRKELERALSYLKVDGCDIIFESTALHLRLDHVPQRELVEKIEAGSRISLNRIRPTVVAIPSCSYNQDHTAGFEAAFTACRPHDRSVKWFPPIVLGCDHPSLFWNPPDRLFQPNCYVDISHYLDRKLEAMSCHRSQLRRGVHHISLDNIRRLAELRGSEVGLRAAEAFFCYRMIL